VQLLQLGIRPYSSRTASIGETTIFKPNSFNWANNHIQAEQLHLGKQPYQGRMASVGIQPYPGRTDSVEDTTISKPNSQKWGYSHIQAEQLQLGCSHIQAELLQFGILYSAQSYSGRTASVRDTAISRQNSFNCGYSNAEQHQLGMQQYSSEQLQAGIKLYLDRTASVENHAIYGKNSFSWGAAISRQNCFGLEYCTVIFRQNSFS